MGKRSKTKLAAIESEVKHKVEGMPTTVTEDLTTESSDTNEVISSSKTKTRKRKLKTVETAIASDQSPVKINKQIQSTNAKLSKNKKIIFKDCDQTSEQDVTAPLIKSKKNQTNEEDEVKDEDIDKFCDEIDEQDNEQYDDWIKQIEAKLHPNKKT